LPFSGAGFAFSLMVSLIEPQLCFKCAKNPVPYPLLSRHVGRSSATFKGVLCLYLLPFVDPGRVVEGTPETILTTNIHGLWYFPNEPASEEKQPSEEE